jgi:hypothetical protein
MSFRRRAGLHGMGPEWVSFLADAPPAAFRRRLVVVPPGGERAYIATEWRDALVVVERGEVELESLGGVRARFAAGAVLWLTGLPLRTLRCTSAEPAVLAAVSRVRPAGRPGTSRPRPAPPSP